MIASGKAVIGCQCARRSACRSPTALLERRLASSDAGWGQVAGAVTAASTRGRTSRPGVYPGGETLPVGTSVVLDAPFGRFLGDADFLIDPASRLAWPNAELVVVHVVTSDEQTLDRLKDRAWTGTPGGSDTGSSSGPEPTPHPARGTARGT